MKRLFMISVLAAGITAVTGCNDEEITNVYPPQKNPEEIEVPKYEFNEDDWYRDIRFADWQKMGVSEDLITSVLARINSGGEFRDERNIDSRGYWTYEFTRAADRVLDEAVKFDDADLYRKASTLYLVASYPNLRRPHEIYAMDKALTYYEKALRMQGENVRIVDITLADSSSVKGVLHMPLTGGEDKVPAMIWTGGVDKTLIEHRSAINGVLEKGYAVLTLDMPGGGTDHKRSLKTHIERDARVTQVSNEASSYQAAYDYLRTHPGVDADKIGILTSSGSGVALFEFVLNGEHKLKAVVARCTLVDGPLTDHELLAEIPKMSADAMNARMGGDAGDLDFFRKHSAPFSLETKGYYQTYEDSVDAPILAINADGDPIAPGDDLEKLLTFSKDKDNSKLVITDEFGHCPELPEAEEIINNFIESQLGR